MQTKEIRELLLYGEGSTTEFKRKIHSPEKIGKEITAFANTIGGYLVIGVDDDGTLYGVPSEKSVVDQVNQTCQFLIEPPVKPQIEVINYQHKELVVVYIPESQNKPHKLLTNGNNQKPEKKAFIRVGEKSISASKEMTRLLSAQRADAKPIKLSIGDREKRLFNYLEKYEKATVNDFSKLVNISKRRAERLLIQLVRVGVLQIHIDSNSDFFTLVEKIK